ncbi:MAG: hypothetical protein CMF67_01535 [Magnetovibrio sp.]|nr:hypothetical protein [Magnetovibrio sp.]
MLRAKSDLKVTASDALEFEAIQSKPHKKRRGLRRVAWGVAFVTFLGGGWFLYGEMLMRLADGNGVDVPLIRVVDGPVKVRPENPGGLQIPNRDKLVYERMQSGASNSSNDSIVERLLPQPEKPLPRPTPGLFVPSSPPNAASGKSQDERIVTPMASPTAPVPGVKDVVSVQPPPPPPLTNTRQGGAPLNLRKNSERPAEPGPTTTPKEPVQAAPKNVTPTNVVSTNITSTPRRSTASTKTPKNMNRAPDRVASLPVKILKPPTGKTFRIQLAAARTPEGAQSEWDRIRQKHVDLLGKFGLTVTKADLGPKKGVFYRLRIGPLANETAARELCKELSMRKMGCLVVMPGR